jgi:hypothetical protein
METLAGGDYFELSAAHTVPAGLASDPPDYGRCIASLEAAQAGSPKKIPGLTGTTLLMKCRAIYESLKIQATAFLVKAALLAVAAHEQGIVASEADVQRSFKQFKTELFPTEADQQQYLAKRRRTLSDELVVVKLDALSQKVEQKISAGKLTLASFLEAFHRWAARTSCSPGYVVEGCSDFKTKPSQYGSLQSPAVLMEQVATIATGRCTNLAACAKQ